MTTDIPKRISRGNGSPKEVKRLKDCPHCFEEIFEKATTCHHCREHIGHFWWLIPRYSIPIIYNLIAAFAISYTFFQTRLNQADQDKFNAQNIAKHAIEQKNAVASDANNAGLESTTSKIPTLNLTINDEASFKNSVLSNSSGDIKKALSLAFSLKDKSRIKFVWGGKTPDEGFDSSGFITYVLFKINIFDSMNYRDFSSQGLKGVFDAVDPKEAKIGDLLIYKSGLVLFYLGGNKGMGIGNSNGIKLYDVDLTKNWDVRRWAGKQVSSVTDNQGHQIGRASCRERV